MLVRLPGIRALVALALLMITTPMFAQTRTATSERSMQRESVTRALESLRTIRGVNYRPARQIAETRNDAKSAATLASASQGSISGTVSFPPGTKPYASLVAVSADLASDAYFIADAQPDGSYSISDVPDGSYVVLAQAYECATEFYDNVFSPDSATPVVVSNSRPTTGIDFALESLPVGEGSIKGKVLAEVGGDAIMGAQVWATPLDNPWNGGWANVDASGDYEITRLFTGSYVVQASAPGFLSEFYNNALTFETATAVRVTEPGATDGVNFSLNPGATITGRVVDVDGKPIAGVMIDAMNDFRKGPDSIVPMPGYASASTDDDGRYILTGLADGEYVVSANYWAPWINVQEWYDNASAPENATTVRARANETTDGIDFTLDIPMSDGSISGVITDTSGRPVEGAYVSIETAYGGRFDVRSGTVSGPDGSYIIEALPDGEYIVGAFSQSGWTTATRYWRDAESPDKADPVTITDGTSDVTSVDIRLPLERGTSSISGTVRLADGTALAGAQVGVIVVDPSNSSIIFGAGAVTDSYGLYTIPYLPAGTYLVYASSWSNDKMGTEWFDNAQDPSSAIPIVLSVDESRSGVDFSLELKSVYGTLSGRVTDDATGAPIANAFVEIAFGGDAMTGAGFAAIPGYALTDDDGRYEVSYVWAGEYFVSVVANGAYEYYDEASSPDNAKSVLVNGGETTTIDFGLTRRSFGNGSITGSVFSDDGSIIDAAIVAAIPANGTGEVFFPAVAEKSGAYAIEGLADGRYYVFAYSPYHISEFYEDAWDFSQAKLVTVSNGGVTPGINFGLASFLSFDDGGRGGAPSVDGGAVHGTVTDNGGKAIADANVYVVNESKQPVASTRTKADGTYEIAGIIPGDGYRIMASSVGYVSEYNDDAREFDQASPMQVRRGRVEVNFSLERSTSSVDDADIASDFSISSAYPNPLTNSTTLRMTLARPTVARVTVVDARGETVAVLHDGVMSQGAVELRWDARSSSGNQLGSGTYFARIESGRTVRSIPLTIAR